MTQRLQKPLQWMEGSEGRMWSPKRLFPSHHGIPVGRLSLHSLTPSGPSLYRAGTIAELISAYSEDHEIPFREGNGKLERSTLCTHRDADHMDRAVPSAQSQFPLYRFCVSKAKGFTIMAPSSIPVFYPTCSSWNCLTIPSHQCWDVMSNM